MKLYRLSIALIFFLQVATVVNLCAQQHESWLGSWQGVLKVPGAQLTLVIHVSEIEGTLSSTFDSPDQGAYDIPFAETLISDKRLQCMAPAMGVVFEAELNGETMKGSWQQGGSSFPMQLERSLGELQKPRRPQEPMPPFPYEEVILNIPVDAGHSLGATLTIPQGEGPFPAVVLISGSGPQGRDSEVFGHKPFLLLADAFTRRGIAVLRYDDRGVDASTGDFAAATTADFAEDAQEAFRFLRKQAKIDPTNVGLAGLSEGGVIGPMVAAQNQEVAFVVMMAGPALPGRDLLLMQSEAVASVGGASEDEVSQILTLNTRLYDWAMAQPNHEAVALGLDDFVESLSSEDLSASLGLDANTLKQLVAPLASPWFYFFLKHDPSPDLYALRCRVLALYGGKDVQVPANENVALLSTIFAESNPLAEIKVFANCNHLFQTAQSGSPDEYVTIEETMAPEVIAYMAQWILGE